MALFGLLALAALLVAALVNGISGRHVVNGGRIGGVAILVVMGVSMALLLASPGPDLGRSVGGLVGRALLPLLLCTWSDRRHAARVRQDRGSAG
jgi:hypothetical protein